MTDNESDDNTENEPKSHEDEELVPKWLKEITAVRECKDQQNFERIGDRIVKKYKN